MARKIPEPNNASLADIAFMLLIFFLVTTTMDIDTGIPRRLPPPVPKDQQNIKPPEVRQRNVFEILINSNNQVLVEGEVLRNVRDLKDMVQEFFTNPTDDENLSEKKEEEIPFYGPMMVSKGVVSLQNDRSTEYGKYIEIQNEIVAAVNELREKEARKKFGESFDKLPEEKQEAISKYYKLAVSEAEPRAVGE